LCDRAGRDEEAVGALEQAIEHGADWPDIHYRLGELLVRRHMGDRASGHFRRALELEATYTRASDALSRLVA
ncbi:MAG: hypothetical protein J7M14_02645, partial [Planctomycetes bacterium]|nr:hypothetical protein [Planctomycetota bacterium]